MKTARIVAGAVLASAAAGLAGGCGYSFQSLYPENVRTVSVPMWHRGRDVYRRGLEMRLTEALVKQIELRTPYKVTHRAADPDTELTGTITRVEQSVLSRNPDTGRPRELELTVTVSFAWRDLRSGETIVERSNFPVTGRYITHAPFSEDFFQGSEDVINRLARRIVEEMESPF
jgi:outer membrane lipopolysaccharide assembly protein LptE/RlpB